MLSFAAVDDTGVFHPEADPEAFIRARSACGMFELTKAQAAPTLRPCGQTPCDPHRNVKPGLTWLFERCYDTVRRFSGPRPKAARHSSPRTV